eukprot:6214792-Pleurochrysis_carterae.AAC.1
MKVDEQLVQVQLVCSRTRGSSRGYESSCSHGGLTIATTVFTIVNTMTVITMVVTTVNTTTGFKQVNITTVFSCGSAVAHVLRCAVVAPGARRRRALTKATLNTATIIAIRIVKPRRATRHIVARQVLLRRVQRGRRSVLNREFSGTACHT